MHRSPQGKQEAQQQCPQGPASREKRSGLLAMGRARRALAGDGKGGDRTKGVAGRTVAEGKQGQRKRLDEHARA